MAGFSKPQAGVSDSSPLPISKSVHCFLSHVWHLFLICPVASTTLVHVSNKTLPAVCTLVALQKPAMHAVDGICKTGCCVVL